MSTDTEDELGERVSKIEGTVVQMDKRMERLETTVDRRFDKSTAN